MEREELQRRFRERVVHHRREYFAFLGGAAFISVALGVGIGAMLYVALTFFLAHRVRRFDNIPLWPFVIVYVALFLVVGYLQYRRRPRRCAGSLLDELCGTLADHPVLSQTVLYATAELSALAVCLTFPSLIFHFAEEVLTGRHLFATEEVLDLAFEILADGGEKVAPEFLQDKLDRHPRALGPALRLLLEMKLLILVRLGSGRALRRSLDGETFLAEGSLSAA